MVFFRKTCVWAFSWQEDKNPCHQSIRNSQSITGYCGPVVSVIFLHFDRKYSGEKMSRLNCKCYPRSNISTWDYKSTIRDNDQHESDCRQRSVVTQKSRQDCYRESLVWQQQSSKGLNRGHDVNYIPTTFWLSCMSCSTTLSWVSCLFLWRPHPLYILCDVSPTLLEILFVSTKRRHWNDRHDISMTYLSRLAKNVIVS